MPSKIPQPIEAMSTWCSSWLAQNLGWQTSSWLSSYFCMTHKIECYILNGWNLSDYIKHEQHSKLYLFSLVKEMCTSFKVKKYSQRIFLMYIGQLCIRSQNEYTALDVIIQITSYKMNWIEVNWGYLIP